MNNPYDIYNDNRAYHGYKRGVNEALDEFIKRYNECDLYDCNCNDEDTVSCAECIAKQIKEEINGEKI